MTPINKNVVRIALLGASGRLGSSINRLCETTLSSQASVALTLSRQDKPIIVLDKIDQFDIIVDVSLPEACVAVALTLIQSPHKILPPLVTGSTGWSVDELKVLTEYAKRGPVLRAPNFSPAVNLFARLLKEYAPRFARLGYEVALSDAHHSQKRDSPSGTAKLLMEQISAAGLKPQLNVVRAGTIVGTHAVTFIGAEDIFEIRHEALNRDLFARGAIVASTWLHGLKLRKPDISGFFQMNDALDES